MPAKKIICVAVDDEPLALSVLEKYISSVDGLKLVGSCANAVEALQILQQNSVDLLFLDIQMPKIMGTDFIRTLKKPPKVIFTTAYRKFAVEGFELDAVDYLLKPISFDRFLKAVNKVMDGSLQNTGDKESIIDKHKEIANSFIHFRSNRKMQKIALDDILYIE